MPNIEEKIEEIVQEPIKELGYELYDVQYVKEGKDYFLRIFINNNEKGIDLEDCEKVSNNINPIIDEKNLIKEAYFLEVSSPGIEKNIRKEKHLKENIGKEIVVKLFKPVQDQKEYIGTLMDYTDRYINIKTLDAILAIDRKNIALMKTFYQW